jgi:hypothetical protein
MTWNIEDKYETTLLPCSAQHSDMLESYSSNEQVFDGFLGGVEVDINIIDNLVDVDVVPADEEGNRKQWQETFPTYQSLDGTKALIRLCCPCGALKSWHGASNDMFYKWANHFGIDNLMTKSEFQNKLDSEDYTLPIADDMV